ncbi:Ionotropic receptor 337 [Blattella germanica]|nr:Ionotropic receptor 337 [Blattella germanica]
MFQKICLILFVCSFLFNISRTDEFEQSMAECVVNIATRFFDENFPLLIYTPGDYYVIGDKLFQTLYKQIPFPKIMFANTAFLQVRQQIKPESYIIIVPPVESNDDVKFIENMFTKIQEEAFNAKGKVILVNFWMVYIEVNLHRIAHFLLQLALKYGFVHTVVLDQQLLYYGKGLIDETDIHVFSWSINDQLNICSRFIDIITHEDTWNSMERRFELQSTLFKHNNKINMKNCVLKVGLQQYPPFVFKFPMELVGPIVEFVEIFCKIINANCRIRNWKYTSVVRDLHIVFPAVYGTTDIFPKTWKSYPYMRTDIAWFVPSGEKHPSWKSLFRTFSPLVWTFVIITFACGVFTMWLQQKYLGRSSGRSVNYDIIFSTLLMHLGVGVPDRSKGFVAVMFFALFLYYTLIINTAYQSAYFGLLVDPGNSPPIQSVKELNESGLIMERMINTYGNDSFWWFVMEYQACKEIMPDMCYEKVALKRTHSIMDNTWMSKMISHLYLDRRGKPKYVIIDEIIGTSFLSLLGTILSPVLGSIMDETLHRIFETGIMFMLSDKAERIFRYGHLHKEFQIDSIYAFSISDFQGAFFLLILGHSLAFIVFLFDVLIQFITNTLYVYVIVFSFEFCGFKI